MFLDLHVHARNTPGPVCGTRFSTPEPLLDRYREIGVEQAVLLPLVSPEFYETESNRESLDIYAFETSISRVDFLFDLRDRGAIGTELFAKVARENALRLLFPERKVSKPAGDGVP